MDELEFLEGLKTDEEQFNELTAGAEHLIRLKKQSEQPTESEKTASYKAIRSAAMMAHGAKAAVKNRAELLAKNVKAVANSKNPSSIRSFEAGMLLGKAAPAAAVGAGAYAVGKHKGKKDAEDEIYGKYASALGGVLGSTLAGAGIGAGIGALRAEKGHRLRGSAEGIGYGALLGSAGGLLGITPDKVMGMAGKAKELKKTQHARSAISALKTPSRNVDMGFDKMWAEGGENKGQLAKALLEAVKGPKIKAASDPLSEKRASLAEKLKQIGPLAGGLMAGGAAAGGIGTYLASKPQEELGGRSRAEDELEAFVEAQKGRPERGLLHKMKNRTTELEHGYARAFSDHPVKASLLGAAAGASGGYALTKLLDALRHGAK